MLGLPYLRTQYFTSSDYGASRTFQDYKIEEYYSEADYGIAILESSLSNCADLGFGRQFVSEIIRVIVPKATGLKEPILEVLSFQSARVCSLRWAPPASFITGVGEASLDFGLFGPLLIVVPIIVLLTFRRRIPTRTANSYLFCLSIYSPIALLWGPAYVVTSTLPIIVVVTSVLIWRSR